MDESFHELEAELKSLQPRRPSAQLVNRINRDLAAELPASARPHYTTATNLSSWKWFGWRMVAAAAVVAFVATVGILNFKPAAEAPSQVVAVPAAAPQKIAVETPPARERYEPVAATNVLYDLKDEGPVRGEGDTSAHRLRYRYLDTYTLKNPKGNASLKWTVPRDEIRVIPASFN